MSQARAVTRVRYEVRRRLVTVKAIERLTLSMVRVVSRGPPLEGFVSLGYDDQLTCRIFACDRRG